MKAKFICFKLSKTIIILFLIIVLQIIFIVIGYVTLKEERSVEEIKQTIPKQENNIPKNIIQEAKTREENRITKVENLPEEYENMPREIKKLKVIGKIEIEKIKLNSYILEETTTKSLKVSITKLYGPPINQEGNFCMAGHNYRNNKMFGGIKKLEINDKIVLTDTFNRSVTYRVYKKDKADPKDISCLEQDTKGERELTLITCTPGATKRVIVKAIEDYD